VLDYDTDGNTTEVTRNFYHRNALGSVMEITDMNQAVVVSYRYDPYGKVTITRGGVTQSSDPLANHWTFTGRFLDEEARLYYYRARFYDPALGRFLQRDPLGYVAGPDLFLYVDGSTTNACDPSGLRGGSAGGLGGPRPGGGPRPIPPERYTNHEDWIRRVREGDQRFRGPRYDPDDPPWQPYEPPPPGTVCVGHWECMCKYKWVHKRTGASSSESTERLGPCPPLGDPTCKEACEKFVYHINMRRWQHRNAAAAEDLDEVNRLNNHEDKTIKRFGVGPFDDEEAQQRVAVVSAKCERVESVCGGCN